MLVVFAWKNERKFRLGKVFYGSKENVTSPSNKPAQIVGVDYPTSIRPNYIEKFLVAATAPFKAAREIH